MSRLRGIAPEKSSAEVPESPGALDICAAQDLITTLSPRRSGWPKGKRREIGRIGRNSGWLSAVTEVTAWWIQGYQAVKKTYRIKWPGYRCFPDGVTPEVTG